MARRPAVRVHLGQLRPALPALPAGGWLRQADLEKGLWAELRPEPVDVPACFGLDRGVWYQVREGVRGVLVYDAAGVPHVYVLTEPATHYYRTMTHSAWAPVLIGERI